MKAIKIISLVALFLNCLISCAQEKRAEEIYQDCLYNSLSDNGEALKRFTKDFEQHLIEIKILKDNSPQSYYNIYKSIANGKRYPYYYKYSYIDSINSIERYKIKPYNEECLKHVNSLWVFKNSKMAKIHKVVKPFAESKTHRFSELISEILPIMEVKDFELDYYKHKTFMYLYFSDDVLFPLD